MMQFMVMSVTKRPPGPPHHGPPGPGRRRRLQSSDEYDVIYQINGVTEEDTLTISSTLEAGTAAFQDEMVKELQAANPGATIEVTGVQATVTEPVIKPADSFYGVLAAVIAGLICLALGVCFFGMMNGVGGFQEMSGVEEFDEDFDFTEMSGDGSIISNERDLEIIV